MSITSGSEKRMASDGMDEPSIDDDNSGGAAGENIALKKGPWTSAEDAILVDYVTRYGEGNWNAVQKNSGLARCGKSCRLRWTNHLRPDLKKGAFTADEENRIIELHAKMGNKWARMAAELPGRTDNEIKNFWNTRVKRLQRAGLPIYPPGICSKALNENQQGGSMNTFSSNNVHRLDYMPLNNFEIPKFKALELNKPMYPPPPILNMPPGSSPGALLTQSMVSSSFQQNKPTLSAVQPSKRLRPAEPLLPSPNVSIKNAFVGGSPYDTSMQITQSLGFPTDCMMMSSSFLNNGSDVVLSGNPSSEPAQAMNPELPSLQTQTGNWGMPSPAPSSPLPSFEMVDVLLQSPPTKHNQSTQNDTGLLLDAVLYESKAIKEPMSNGYLQPSCPVSIMPHDLHEADWDLYDEELSSLCQSSSSVFSTSTPLSGTSFDELHSASTFLGCKVKEEAHLESMLYDDKVETTNQRISSRPDFLLANDFGPMKYPTNPTNPANDYSYVATFLVDDLSCDCKPNDTGANPLPHDNGQNPCPNPSEVMHK